MKTGTRNSRLDITAVGKSSYNTQKLINLIQELSKMSEIGILKFSGRIHKGGTADYGNIKCAGKSNISVHPEKTRGLIKGTFVTFDFKGR